MSINTPIVFFGTDEFAVIVLDALIKAGFDLQAVITTPDEPAGRKKELKPSPVKLAAISHKLKVLQPENLNDPESFTALQLYSSIAPLGVLTVYGKIIPKKVLDHFPKGILNIHPSLLPRYRGPSPIKTAILNGDAETGVTIMKLSEGMDEGPIISQNVYRVARNARHIELRNALAQLGSELLIKSIPDYLSGELIPRPQDSAQATYTKRFTKDDGRVDLQSDSSQAIYNKFRAFDDWPGVWFLHKGKRVKIIDCALIGGVLELLKLQPEGGKPMSLRDFINGYGKL